MIRRRVALIASTWAFEGRCVRVATIPARLALIVLASLTNELIW